MTLMDIKIVGFILLGIALASIGSNREIHKASIDVRSRVPS